MTVAQMWLAWVVGWGFGVISLIVRAPAPLSMIARSRRGRRAYGLTGLVLLLAFVAIGFGAGIAHVRADTAADSARLVPPLAEFIALAVVFLGFLALIHAIADMRIWWRIRSTNKLLASGRWSDALARYDWVLARRSGTVAAWCGRAFALSSLDRYSEALAACESALALNPKSPQAWYVKGGALLATQHYQEAVAACDRALALSPHYSAARTIKAAALQRLDRAEEALAVCAKARDAQLSNALFQVTKARALDDLGRYEEALDCAEHAIQNDAQAALPWLAKATCLHHLHRDQEALAAAERALALADAKLAARPSYISAWEAKADALRILGRDDETRDARPWSIGR